MTLTQFLQRILPEEGVKFVVISDGKRMGHIGCDSIEQMARTIESYDKRDGFTVYHACAAYKQKPYFDPDRNRKVCRVKENWLSAKAFWVDIDVGESKAKDGKGYATQAEASAAIKAFCRKLHLPLPTVVSSGHGLHLYWCLSEPLDPVSWQRTATKLKALLNAEGIVADPSRTADFASVLRPVGTHNKKDPASPLVVQCLYEGQVLPTGKFVAFIDEHTEGLAGLDDVPDYLKGAEDKVETYPTFDIDANVVADRCNQIRIVRDTKGDAGYDHWRGTIGILKFCQDGIRYAEEWTENRASTGHTSCDWQTRYETWDSPPATCKFFETANAKGCEGCPFKDKIKTPLVLGRQQPLPPPKPEKSEDKTEEGPSEPQLPEGYAYEDGLLVRYAPDKKGVLQARPFTSTYFYIEKPITNADGDDEYLVVYRHPKTQQKLWFYLEGKLVGAGGNQLVQALGAHSILPLTTKEAVLDMTAYIRDSVTKVVCEVETVPTVTHFGWVKTGFVIGNQIYLNGSGEAKPALLAGNAAKKCGAFQVTGTLEGYAHNLNWVYNRPGMEAMQYAICSMWGSLLTPFCDTVYRGIPCVLSGASSGKGKTSAGLSAMYAFGDAQKLVIASKDGATQMALTALLGTFRNIPLLLDEMTNISPQELSRLSYSLATGEDRSRLRSSGGGVSLADQESWSSQSLITCNSHMTATLMQSGNTEAEALRLFEIRVDKYGIPQLDPIEVSHHLNELSKNSGVAGRAFVEYLTKNYEDIPGILRSFTKDGSLGQRLMIDSRYRFYRYHVICTLAAASIMHQLGVCDFDLDRLKEFAVKAVDDLSNEVKNNSPDPVHMLVQMLRDFEDGTIETPLFDYKREDNHPSKDHFRFREPLRVRRIVSHDEVKDTTYDNTAIIYSSDVNSWLYENRSVDIELFERELSSLHILRKMKDKKGNPLLSLGKGIEGLTSPRSRCWIIDLKKLDEVLNSKGD